MHTVALVQFIVHEMYIIQIDKIISYAKVALIRKKIKSINLLVIIVE